MVSGFQGPALESARESASSHIEISQPFVYEGVFMARAQGGVVRAGRLIRLQYGNLDASRSALG